MTDIYKTSDQATVTLSGGDIEIGAVEGKDGTTDTRLKIGVVTAIAETDNAAAVQAPVLGVTSGAKVITDVAGTIQQYLRGLIHLLISKITVVAEVSSMPVNTTTAGTVTALAGTVVATLPGGCSSVALQVTGTWVGQLEFEGTVDGTNFVAVEASNGTATINATVGNDVFVLPGGGYSKIRVRASAWTSGTATVTFIASTGAASSILTGPLPGGTNALGSVTANAGTNLNTSALALESGKLTQHGQHMGVGGQVIAIGAVAVRSTQMAAGTWRISGSGDIWFKQGTVAVTASAAATSTYLAAGAVETFVVVGAGVDDYVSVIQDGSETGNVSITKLF
jgi:hypothetical protein